MFRGGVWCLFKRGVFTARSQCTVPVSRASSTAGWKEVGVKSLATATRWNATAWSCNIGTATRSMHSVAGGRTLGGGSAAFGDRAMVKSMSGLQGFTWNGIFTQQVAFGSSTILKRFKITGNGLLKFKSSDHHKKRSKRSRKVNRRKIKTRYMDHTHPRFKPLMRVILGTANNLKLKKNVAKKKRKIRILKANQT